MPKDYVLFLHGVSVRESPENEKAQRYTYADPLFDLIQQTIKPKAPNRTCVKVPLYWGNVNREALNELLAGLKGSSTWNQLSFREFREAQMLPFIGDAALYISRLIGSQAADQIKTQAFKELSQHEPGDRLHLVTHSWGSVILFDILFASRWDNPKIPGYQSVQAIREQIYGLGRNPTTGIRLSSIQTMGSPIALFSLLTISGRNANNESTHDLSPGLEALLKNLSLGSRKLLWLNFIHPSDPVAWPLEKLINKLIVGSERYLQVEDVLTGGGGFFSFITQSGPFKQTIVSLASGGKAHESYWQNKDLALRIAQNILSRG